MAVKMTPSVRIDVSGARGESQADILRRTGQFGVLPTDSDEEAVGKLNADAAQSAGFAEEFSGPAYATVAEGEAATATGHFFRVPIAGTNPVEYKRYERTAGGSVVAASLATTAALGAPNGAALIGLPQGGTVAGAIGWVTPQMFLPAGVVTTDDWWPLVKAAFAFANALKRTGATANIFHPGCAVVIPGGRYLLASIDGELAIECDVIDQGGSFVVPSDYVGTVFRVGSATPGQIVAEAKISLPELTRVTGVIPSGSIGLKLMNLYSSTVMMRRIEYFDKPFAARPTGFGCAYNTIHLGQSSSGNVMFDAEPQDGGWFNANTIIGSNWYLSGNRIPGKRFVRLDGSDGHEVYGNLFIGLAMEGGGAEFAIEGRNAINNVFLRPYMETGQAGIAVTVAGPTLTHAAHDLSVGEMVTFLATSLPGGMVDTQPFFVVATPTADTFQVSLDRDGDPITFTSSGMGVIYFQAMRCRWDGEDGMVTTGNALLHRAAPLISPIDHIQTGQALKNGEESVNLRFSENYSPSDIPAFRARNTFASDTISRVMFAAYPPNIDPQANPTLWKAGLSDRGLLFKNNDGTIAGRLWFDGGFIFYEPANAGITRTIAPSTRTLGGPLALGAANVPANGELAVTVTMAGIQVGDHPVLGWVDDLPTGISVQWVRVSAANTLKISFRNHTGAGIDLTGADFSALATVQYN
ncbi:hypothetical protein [Novosphingobium sp. HII-3]|uniref:hypothetical protein n=1 Tax=Novosphingobium sp. HII-3 TaxID=2075565 RepID=UPI000CDA90E5|nr:hypothetical protein [Novosphingobium sp. HII-3]